MINRLVVKKTDSLADLECLARALRSAEHEAANAVLRLPVDFGSQFFKESWLVGLLATAHQLGIPIQEPKLAMLDPTYTSIVAFSQNLYRRLAVGVSEGGGGDEMRKFLDPLIAAGGLLETRDSSRALTICAIDPFLPKPFVLGVGDSLSEFFSSFRGFRRRQFEVGDAAGFSEKYPESARGLDEFVGEIYQNTLFHGRFDADDVLLPGLRYIQIRRHIGHKHREFREKASGFAELCQYIDATIRSDTTHTLLEISIGDRGIGLVDRLIATRKNLREELLKATKKTRLGAINHIIRFRISSRTNSPGSGSGLTNALSAISRLRGFVSLRSGGEWAYRDFSGSTVDPDGATFKSGLVDDALLPVTSEGDIAHMSGTHFNILLPVSRQ